jgi:hypothetical protein
MHIDLKQVLQVFNLLMVILQEYIAKTINTFHFGKVLLNI